VTIFLEISIGSKYAMTPRMTLLHHDLTEVIIGIYQDVYTELGHGFLERIYQQAMVIAQGSRLVSRGTDAVPGAIPRTGPR
jgi:hypothetical protein